MIGSNSLTTEFALLRAECSGYLHDLGLDKGKLGLFVVIVVLGFVLETGSLCSPGSPGLTMLTRLALNSQILLSLKC